MGTPGEGLGFGTADETMLQKREYLPRHRAHKCRDAAPKTKAMAKRAQEKFLKIIYPQRDSLLESRSHVFQQHPVEPTAGISFVVWRQRISAAFCKISFLQEADKPSQAAANLELKVFPLPVGCSELPCRQDLLQTTHSSSHCSRTGIPCKALLTWGVKQEG